MLPSVDGHFYEVASYYEHTPYAQARKRLDRLNFACEGGWEVGRLLKQSYCGGVGSQNCMMRTQTTHCAGLPTVGGGTPMPRMNLLSPFVPVGWRVALFGGLDDDVDVCLEGGRPGGPRVDMLHSVGR